MKPVRTRSVNTAGVRKALLPFLVVATLLIAACGQSPNDGAEAGEDGGRGQGDEQVASAEEAPVVLDGYYVVEPGDTLGEIVYQVCGESSPELVLNVVEVNQSNQQDDGGYLTDVDRIEAGWILQIPCELPLPPLIDCPASAEAVFVAQGERARVLLCNTGDKTEYFGQRLEDRASTTLDACRREDGLVEAVNPGQSVDTFYLVDTGAGRVDVRQDSKGVDPLDSDLLVSYELADKVDDSTERVRPCGTPTPPPVEETVVIYPLDPAPTTLVEFDDSKPTPTHRECTDELTSSTMPILGLPGSPDADPTRWLQHPQGRRLGLGGLPERATVRMTGGGHEWVMEPTYYEDQYELDITDAHPFGRYLITVDGSDEPAARVEVVQQEEALIVLDQPESGDGYYVFRVYGGQADLSVRVKQRDGCESRWHTHQEIGRTQVNSGGVAKLELDFRQAPAEQFCLAIDDVCFRSMYPGL